MTAVLRHGTHICERMCTRRAEHAVRNVALVVSIDDGALSVSVCLRLCGAKDDSSATEVGMHG